MFPKSPDDIANELKDRVRKSLQNYEQRRSAPHYYCPVCRSLFTTGRNAKRARIPCFLPYCNGMAELRGA